MNSQASTIPTGFRLKRTVRLDGITQEQSQQIQLLYADDPNIENLSFDLKSKTMTAQYHGAYVGIDSIISALSELGVKPSRRFRDRVKLGWYRYGDENTRDNARLEPFCCSKIPPGK